MLHVDFEGWFQCRLATDPDPPEEPRGVSGFTFATAGEPDFDRIIRFHDPTAPRSHGPKPGVFVKAVSLEDKTLKDHPLVGARFDLLAEPKFESRNYILRDSSQGPIVPFHLRISGDGMMIEREDILYPLDPKLPLHRIPLDYLERRGSWIPMTIDRVRVAEATGIKDPLAYRQKRKTLLEADLRKTEDPAAIASLQKRIDELSITDINTLQVLTMTVYNDYRFEMNGPCRVFGPEDRLNCAIDTAADWPIAFWMGAWDSDALCGYVRGILSLPLRHPTSDSSLTR